MAIKDSDNINFMEVYHELTGTTNCRKLNISLKKLFSIANDDYFDKKYKGNKDMLKCFKNYGIHNSRKLKIEKIKSILI